jgi:hypothetical protein
MLWNSVENSEFCQISACCEEATNFWLSKKIVSVIISQQGVTMALSLIIFLEAMWLPRGL